LAGAQAWAAGLGLTSLPSLFVNGKLYKGDPAAPADILRQLPYTLREQYPQLVAEVKAQRITDKDDVLTAFCTQSATRSRILPALDSEAAAALPKPWLPELVRETWTSLPGDKHTFAAQNYIFPPVLPDGVAARHTHWAVVDPTTRSGLRLLVSLVQRVHEGKGGTRAAVWFNPAAGETWSSDSRDFAAAIKTLLMCGASDTQLAEVRVATEKMLALAISSPSPDKISDDERKAIKDILSGVQCSAKNPDGGLHISSDHIMADIEFVSRTFGLAPGGTALLTDGKWHVPSAGEPLFSADLAALELAEKRTERAATLLQALKSEWKRWTETGGSGVLSDIVMAIGSVLPEAGNAWEMPKGLATDYTLLKSDGDTAEGALVRVSAIVNPLTTAAQSIASMLCVLQEKLGSALAYEVLVLPAVDVGAEGKLPMDKYYRFVVASEVGFEPDGSLSAGAGAVFKQLPTTPTLTLGMHTLNSWMIGPESALYDLDNIVLADLGSSSTLYAEWKMLHLLIQGSCASYVNSTDTALVSGAQPTDAPSQLTMEGVASGLELLLGESKHRPHVADTLVMENLGYFQLKAGPGLWYLHMGNKKYELSDKLEGATVVNFGTAKHPLQGAPILVNSWSGSTDTLKVMRVGKLDKYEEQLQSSSFFQPMSNLFSGLLSEQKDGEKSALVKGESYNPDKDPDCIHIYTLASGHAYERFIKIMIQSLLEHTQSKVKFWLLDNFASPQFKDFLPVMAKEYGFYFEFVTYNWPHWLRRQTQKQRVMWGYKILFLDVLFPLEVKRCAMYSDAIHSHSLRQSIDSERLRRSVIFVDADQILRADVKVTTLST
jgi:UDP-glucose:glycoprotein glucosyltransferase